MTPPTLVLIHGAGDTARVWRAVRACLRHDSIAIDLLGRESRPYDLTAVTLERTAAVAADDVRESCSGRVILVGHSAGGLVVPRLGALLGDAVCHLVFIAGVVAPHGGLAVDVVHPERRAEFEQHRPRILGRYRRHTFVRRGGRGIDARGLAVIEDPKIARSVESMNLLFQPGSWEGVPAGLPRTFVRCLGDPIQSREMQERLIAAAGADEVIDIEADHTPARSAPEALAEILDAIAARHEAT
jgi:pimeloyl-ACP methyl ester carboxylesterase